jgi:DNA-binding transcriptional LysR family regulator
MLSHKQLTVFTAIAEHGSITKASESLNLTQPALSSALSSLESELGVRLFDRIDRKIVLNHNGELLYPKVMQLLEDTAKIQNFFNHEQTLTGSIHIAASNTIGNYILPPLMASFKEKHPDTQLALSIGNSERVIESVVGHQADIGFIEAPCLNNQINSFAFAKDQLALFVRHGHPLAKQKIVSVGELKQHPFILREKGSGSRTVVEQILLPLLNYQLNLFLELGSSGAICLATERSDAIGCVLASALQNQKTIHVLNCPEIRLERDFFVVQNRRAHISELTEEWLDWVINK